MFSMKSRRRAGTITAVMLLIAGGAAIGWGVQQRFIQADESTAEPKVAAPNCSQGPWAWQTTIMRPTLERPYSDADLVALVEITNREVVADASKDGISYFGVHTATVVQTLKGSTGGQTITIGTITECLELGRYILFLEQTGTGQIESYEDDPEKPQNPGQYVVLSLQGQYEIVDGRVVPGTSPNAGTDALTRGLTEEEFISLLDEIGRSAELSD